MLPSSPNCGAEANKLPAVADDPAPPYWRDTAEDEVPGPLLAPPVRCSAWFGAARSPSTGPIIPAQCCRQLLDQPGHPLMHCRHLAAEVRPVSRDDEVFFAAV